MYIFTMHARERIQERLGITEEAVDAALRDTASSVRIKSDIRVHDGTYGAVGSATKIDHVLFMDKLTARYGIARIERESRTVLTVISPDDAHADIRAKVYGGDDRIEQGKLTLARRLGLAPSPERYSAMLTVVYVNGSRKSKKLGSIEVAPGSAAPQDYLDSVVAAAKVAMDDFKSKGNVVAAYINVANSDGQVVKCVDLIEG